MCLFLPPFIIKHEEHDLEVVWHMQTSTGCRKPLMRSQNGCTHVKNTMQISGWKVYSTAADTINHCQLMYHSFTSGHRTYHQHTVKSTSSGCTSTSAISPSASPCQMWTVEDGTASPWPAQSITSCPRWRRGRSSPAGAWAPWEWGSYFAAWHKGHLFTVLCSLGAPMWTLTGK